MSLFIFYHEIEIKVTVLNVSTKRKKVAKERNDRRKKNYMNS